MIAESPIGRYASSPEELRERIAAENAGHPFLVYRDGRHVQHIHTLPASGSVSIGRRLANDVPLEWDTEVSRVHARLEYMSGEWTVVDDGLSTNGSWLNGERVTTRRRLRDRDQLRLGNTVIAFLQPGDRESDATVAADDEVGIRELTDRQREILVALARPYRSRNSLATPATNKDIAVEVNLSVDAVKGHLRVLFEKFGLHDLPQNQKRTQLVWRAFRSGAISATDLWSDS